MPPLVLPYADHEPVLDPTTWLAPNATVVGQVRLHARSSVFYGAVVRGDMAEVVVGRGTNLQDNVVVHTDTDFPALIGLGVSVGHAAVVHGCTIENHCLIGMNATVLNGAVIGAGSLVAAGSVVLEGTVVPPGSLVAGVPGQVRRTLTEAERARILANAEAYERLVVGHRAATRDA